MQLACDRKASGGTALAEMCRRGRVGCADPAMDSRSLIRVRDPKVNQRPRIACLPSESQGRPKEGIQQRPTMRACAIFRMDSVWESFPLSFTHKTLILLVGADGLEPPTFAL